jgi:hypothetical protein
MLALRAASLRLCSARWSRRGSPVALRLWVLPTTALQLLCVAPWAVGLVVYLSLSATQTPGDGSLRSLCSIRVVGMFASCGTSLGAFCQPAGSRACRLVGTYSLSVSSLVDLPGWLTLLHHWLPAWLLDCGVVRGLLQSRGRTLLGTMICWGCPARYMLRNMLLLST